jgi:hypothetical protein
VAVAAFLAIAAACSKGDSAESDEQLTVADVAEFKPTSTPTPIPPHTGNLDLRLDATGIPPADWYWAEIDDPLGQKAWRAAVNADDKHRATAHTLGLPPGIYNIQLTTADGVLLRHYAIRVVHHKVR